MKIRVVLPVAGVARAAPVSGEIGSSEIGRAAAGRSSAPSRRVDAFLVGIRAA